MTGVTFRCARAIEESSSGFAVVVHLVVDVLSSKIADHGFQTLHDSRHSIIRKPVGRVSKGAGND